MKTMQMIRLAAVMAVATFAVAATGQDATLRPIPYAPVYYPSPGQGLGPAAPCPICAVDGSQCCVCGKCGRPREARWEDARFIAWQAYAQGEYVGHARTAHVPDYRLRVDDQLDMLYRITRDETRDALPAQRGRRGSRRVVHRSRPEPRPDDRSPTARSPCGSWARSTPRAGPWRSSATPWRSSTRSTTRCRRSR